MVCRRPKTLTYQPSRAAYASEEMLYADRKNRSAGTIAYSLILRTILPEKSATFGIML
jgi:hypothetical protein